MRKVTEKISKNLNETTEVAKIFLNEIFESKTRQNGATVVCLSGDLGSGKTAFTQSIAKLLGIKEKVGSPTFVIMKNYELQITNYKKLFHIDAYRLKNEKELLYLGWEEIIKNQQHIVFIEWPENVEGVIPKNANYIYISINKDGHRNLQLK